MDPEGRKCLLCDGRRFPGKAFCRHEHESQRHHLNLAKEEKIAKAQTRLLRILTRKAVETFRETITSKHGSVAQRCEQPPQELNVSSGQPVDRILPPPQSLPSIAPRIQVSQEMSAKQSIEGAGKSRAQSPPVEEEWRMDHQTGNNALKLKRKRVILESGAGQRSAQTKPKRAKAAAKQGEARHDVLIQISSTVLDEILQLRPDIFDADWNRRSTPPPDGWQAVGPSTVPNPRQVDSREEVDHARMDVYPRGFTKMSWDNSPCPSRCDDPADSDYRDEAGEENDGDDELAGKWA